MWYFLVIFNTKIIKGTKIMITIITPIIVVIIVSWTTTWKGGAIGGIGGGGQKDADSALLSCWTPRNLISFSSVWESKTSRSSSSVRVSLIATSSTSWDVRSRGDGGGANIMLDHRWQVRMMAEISLKHITNIMLDHHWRAAQDHLEGSGVAVGQLNGEWEERSKLWSRGGGNHVLNHF